MALLASFSYKDSTLLDILFVSFVIGVVLAICQMFTRGNTSKQAQTSTVPETKPIKADLLSNRQYKLVFPHIMRVLHGFKIDQRFTASEVHRQVNNMHKNDHCFGKRMVRLALYRMVNDGMLEQHPIDCGTRHRRRLQGCEFSWPGKRK